MEKITLYPQGKDITLTYGELSVEGGVVIEKSRQEIEAIISVPHEELSKALAKIRQWYEDNKPQEQKFKLTGFSKKISSIIKNYE